MTTSTQPIQPLASGDIAQEKLKFGEKLSYLLATMAPNPLLGLTSGYLMIFYTNVIGLNPIAIGSSRTPPMTRTDTSATAAPANAPIPKAAVPITFK